jgi:hypothetical protein
VSGIRNEPAKNAVPAAQERDYLLLFHDDERNLEFLQTLESLEGISPRRLNKQSVTENDLVD